MSVEPHFFLSLSRKATLVRLWILLPVSIVVVEVVLAAMVVLLVLACGGGGVGHGG